MTQSIDDCQFPALLAHTLRKDWGVGLLAGERDGKRRYLFENGEERTLANGFYQLMQRVEKPSPEQQADYVRLRGVLAARARDSASAAGQPGGWSLLDQLTRFHEAYPGGLSDPKWTTEVRGEDALVRAPSHRQAAISEAQEQLSVDALDALLNSQQFGQIWDRVITVLRHTDLVPSAQLKQKSPSPEHVRTLAVAVRELLHGSAVYNLRFDRFLGAYVEAFGEYPRWELATAPSALVHPTEHVCVAPTVFRRQLKASSSRRSLAAQPSSAGYTSCLGIARLLSNKLSENEEVPRDLIDVRDFSAFTLKPIPRTKPARPKRAAKPAKVEPEDDDDDDDASAESSDDTE